MGYFLVPLLLTVLIEAPVIAVAGRWAKPAWAAGVLVNTLTNPAVVLVALTLGRIVWGRWGDAGWWVLAAGLELAVVTVECAALALVLDWSARRALAVSIASNALSFAAGGWLLSRLAAW